MANKSRQSANLVSDTNLYVDVINNKVGVGTLTPTEKLHVTGNLYVSGNISFGGTTTQLTAEQLQIVDADIVLGIGTSFSPTDNTANHGGIAVASTEGSPLVSLKIAPGETNPDTYKKFMWFKNNATGLGTDAWLANYAVGIGSTQFPTGTRLAAGNVQFSQNDLTVVRNINSSGFTTATNLRVTSGLYDSNNNVGTAGSVLISTGAGIAWTSGGMRVIDSQIYSTVGITTWTKPAGAKIVSFAVVGGGGGGGGGGASSGTNGPGGTGGGAGGAVVLYTLGADFFNSTEPVIVGTGGTGGIGTTRTLSGINAGTNGGAGGNSQFSGFIAVGGGGGEYSSATGAVGFGGNPDIWVASTVTRNNTTGVTVTESTTIIPYVGTSGAGGSGSATDKNPAAVAAVNVSDPCPAGGGFGGSPGTLTASENGGAGASAGTSSNTITGGTGGTSGSINGTSGNNQLSSYGVYAAGGGGGFGAYVASGIATSGTGGAGGFPGGGGGGGGSARNNTAGSTAIGGTGGNGGRGVVIVITYG